MANNRVKCVPRGCKKWNHLSEGEHEQSGESEHEQSGEGKQSGEGDTNTGDHSHPPEILDIQIDYEKDEIIYGTSWSEPMDEVELLEKLRKIADIETLEELEELITIKSVVLKELPPEHLCAKCWVVNNRVKCIPRGCKKWEH